MFKAQEMRILYLFSTADTSVSRVTLNQISALRKFYPALNIKIACINYDEKKSLLDSENIFKKKYYDNKIVNYIKSLLFIRKVKKTFCPDITISNQNAVTTYNCLVDSNDVKIGIFHAPNFQIKQRGFLPFFLNSLSLKWILPKLDTLVGISQEVCDDLKRNVQTSDIRLQYNIHNYRDIITKSVLPSSVTIEDEGKIKIMSLGTIDYNKRQDLLITLLSQTKGLKLYIVGNIVEQEYYNLLLELIEKNSLEDSVMFIPFLSNPYPLIKNMDCIISTSESEGLPGVLIESLVLNTPVISTNSSHGVWEIFDEKENYIKDLDSLYFCQKGIIVPNPKAVEEKKIIGLLSEALQYITKNRNTYSKNEFKFYNEISENSIHSFYSLLKEKYNENINRQF